jgi:hypothetical protein
LVLQNTKCGLDLDLDPPGPDGYPDPGSRHYQEASMRAMVPFSLMKINISGNTSM